VFSNVRLDIVGVEGVKAANMYLVGNELPLFCRGVDAVGGFLDLAGFLPGAGQLAARQSRGKAWSNSFEPEHLPRVGYH